MTPTELFIIVSLAFVWFMLFTLCVSSLVSENRYRREYGRDWRKTRARIRRKQNREWYK
jgi:hypothetical protein